MTPGKRDKDVTLKMWLLITEASSLAGIAVLPYTFKLMEKAIAESTARMKADGKKLPSKSTIVLLSAAQSQVMFGLVSWLGLRAARSIGLGLPHLEAMLRGESSKLNGGQVAKWAAGGAVSALGMILLDVTLFKQVRAQLEKAGLKEPGPLLGLLATPYGAIAEEVLLRLGLQSFLAAGLRKVRSDGETPPSGGTMWPAILVSNLAFGAGHLPTAGRITRLTPTFITRTLVLNAVVGILCGHLYWREGLEAAMIAHGSADIVLHVAAPLVQPLVEQG